MYIMYMCMYMFTYMFALIKYFNRYIYQQVHTCKIYFVHSHCVYERSCSEPLRYPRGARNRTCRCVNDGGYIGVDVCVCEGEGKRERGGR